MQKKQINQINEVSTGENHEENVFCWLGLRCVNNVFYWYSKAGPIIVFDGFEGTQIDPYWTIYSQNASASLSTNQSYSGQQSLQITAPMVYGGLQQDAHISHYSGPRILDSGLSC